MQEVAAVGAAGTWVLVGRGRADLRWDVDENEMGCR